MWCLGRARRTVSDRHKRDLAATIRGLSWLLHERLRAAVERADPVEDLPVRHPRAGLEFPVLPDAHAEAPRGLGDRPGATRLVGRTTNS